MPDNFAIALFGSQRPVKGPLNSRGKFPLQHPKSGLQGLVGEAKWGFQKVSHAHGARASSAP